MKPERCERCGRGFQKTPVLNYCRLCFRDLCPSCIRKGCCGCVPALVGDPVNTAMGTYDEDPGHFVGDDVLPQKSFGFRSMRKGRYYNRE